MNGKDTIVSQSPAAAPHLPAPIQALINELTMQRDMMGQRAAQFAMRLAGAEMAVQEQSALLEQARQEIVKLQKYKSEKPADDMPAAAE